MGDPAFVATVEGLAGSMLDIISMLIEAREDPNVGDALDAQICALGDTVDDLEAMIGGKSGKRRALKSGRSGGFYCPSGKSGKTYAPSATGAPTYLKSGKGAKSSKTYAPTDVAYSMKSGNRKL